MNESARTRERVEEKKLQMRKEKMEWDMAKVLLDPGSDATEEERAQLTGMLRKRLFNSLAADTCDGDSNKSSRLNEPQEEGGLRNGTDRQEAFTASALLQMSNPSTE